MSRSGLYRAPFGDKVYDFRLAIGELEELQELCDAGPEEIWSRVVEGRWRVKDLTETLRLGLKGGGMEPTNALVMVERYAAPGYLASLKPLVSNILSAALIGAPDEDGEQPEGEGPGERDPSPAEKSGSPVSTKWEEPSVTPPPRSRKARSGR